MNTPDGTKILEPLAHTRNCSAWKDLNGYDVNGEDCTCGLRWRIEIETLQTLKAAWEKRAYQGEAERDAALEQVRVLKNYAHHDAGCMYNHTDKCTCGLFAALKPRASVPLETLRKQVRVLREIVSRYHSAHSFLDDGEGCELCDDAEASLNPTTSMQVETLLEQVRGMRDALDVCRLHAIYGTGTRTKDARGRIFSAIIEQVDAVLNPTAPVQQDAKLAPSVQRRPSPTVEVVAKKLRALLTVKNASDMDIDYCIEQLAALAQDAQKGGA